MLFFVGGERRDEAGEGERERGREQERGMRESFFSLIKVLFYGIPWCSIFLESYGNQETMPVSVLLLFHVSSTWKITAKFLLGNQVRNLATVTGGTSRKYTKPKKLGSQVQTWQNFAKL
jgi:hypothetical protein